MIDSLQGIANITIMIFGCGELGRLALLPWKRMQKCMVVITLQIFHILIYSRYLHSIE